MKRTAPRLLALRCSALLPALSWLALACGSTGPADESAGGPAGAARVGPASEARPHQPRAGAPGVGDTYYPGLGNGGYDVRHYHVELDVDPDSGRVEGLATIDAVATHDLASFNLDLWRLAVEEVRVDDVEADFAHEGRELTIRPADFLGNGRRFRTTVRYGGVPEPAPDASVAGMGVKGVGWWRRDSGSYVVSECAGTASWLPSNDHPRDKATFSFDVTVPEPWQVAANGLLTGVDEADGERTFRWRASDPMATYLATVNVMQLELELSEGPRGLPLRLYYPEDATENELEGFRKAGEMIEFFEPLFGPYPFEAYGGLIAPEEFGGALETQTLPVYSRGMGESTVAHELAHQWFGNCVTPSEWRDMWLNEGFASYAEWLWREKNRGKEAVERRARRAYRFLRAREIGSPVDPGVEQLFSGRTYLRGAFFLHVLRLEIGDESFFRLLRRWVADHHDSNASTADFVALAKEVSGRDLTEVFQSYLFDPVIPETERFERTSRRRNDPETSAEEEGSR